MLRPTFLVLGTLTLTLACHAVRPAPAAGAPAATVPDASADEPLVKGNVETDAEYARAIREHYTKYEHRVPMRDGVRLFTAVYVPKDTKHRYPIMLQRTPYSVGPYGVDLYPSDKNARAMRRFAPSTQMLKEGYVFVHQDVRGRMMSEGTFVDVRPHRTGNAKTDVDESTDAWDTIDWLVKNVPNNGRVGTWGISYPGFYAAQAAIDAHPALKAASPQAPVTEWFIGDDFHHNGALFLAAAFDFYASFGKPRPEPTKKGKWESQHESEDVYDFFLAMGPIANADKKWLDGKIAFWNEMLAHPNRDEWWKARDPRPHYKDARPAIMTVGGWYDAEDLWGALETYRAYEKGAKSENVLVMGPWSHGGWARHDGDRLGDVTFGQKTSLYYREHIEAPFFARHLKGKKGAPAPEATVFERGTNMWRTYDKWPPPEAKPVTLWFGANGKLATKAADAEPDEFVSDPKKPVPYRAKPSDAIDQDFMTEDQRFAARRPDVVVYATEPLADDVLLTGPIEASVWLSTTGTDADVVVKLVDVWPADTAAENNVHFGGYQELVRAEVMRGRFRNSFEKPEPFKPNEPALVKVTLPDVAHTFRTGHRLMVQVQSSWFPLVDRNPQTFVDIAKATDADFKLATHRIFKGGDKASSVKLLVSRGAL
ncbi:MAG: CocE/NonD family hydrolase [Labilithrix sp.]|nr:CocE/NonD family hydrolase [Labilithrix sp.]MCW5813451.1 CocE/NonD family hydrolase [Labilithrix sp.]